MPIDPSIPFGARTFSLGNTFMDAMQQGGQARIQQSQMRAQQTLDDERRQKLKEAQHAESEQQKFYAIVSKPGQTPDGAAEEIRMTVPSLYQPYLKQRAELDAKAGEISKAKAETKKLQTEIATKGQEYAAPFLQLVEKAQYNPDAFAFALNTIKSHFDDFPAEQMLAQAGGDPAKIKQIIDGFKSPQQQQADTAAASGAARLPGEQAASAQALRTLAGTSPTGITAAQAATNANAAANTRIAQSRETREAAVAKREGALYDTSGGTGASVMAPGQRDDALLAKLPTGTADKVKALVEGRLALPSRITKGDTYWQGLLDLAVKYDPSFDAVNYNARSKTRADFTSGASAKNINAIQTVIGHLADLSDKAEALHNGSIPALNSVKNWLSSASGGAAVPSFQTIKKGVTDELTRVWRQAGGSEADIKSWAENLNSSQSPDQFKGVLSTVGDMLESKLGALDTQYQQGMGTDKVSTISPESRKHLDKLKGTAAAAAPAHAVGDTVIGPDGKPHKILEVSPDGKQFRLAGG